LFSRVILQAEAFLTLSRRERRFLAHLRRILVRGFTRGLENWRRNVPRSNVEILESLGDFGTRAIGATLSELEVWRDAHVWSKSG
jgi:hypothetical protein